MLLAALQAITAQHLYFINEGPQAGEGEGAVKGNGAAGSEAGQAIGSLSHPQLQKACFRISYHT